MDALYRKMARLAELLDMELIKLDRYSGWPERTDSAFLEKFRKAHLRVCGYNAELERVHGGIEVGMIVGAIPDMDAVGYAPTARGAHTTQEYLVIDEVEPFWLVLKEVLASRG
ncbi:MAG: aminoacyl-histidine dipeptidase [Ruminococcaceae bacterium]|nr:aminoacyl-histidine dipeptidase [Oscillospiraceae bacterium]